MLYSTENALAYGVNASEPDKRRLRALEGEFSKQCYAAIDRGQLNLASIFATQKQFCNEALNAKKIIVQLEKRKMIELKNSVESMAMEAGR